METSERVISRLNNPDYRIYKILVGDICVGYIYIFCGEDVQFCINLMFLLPKYLKKSDENKYI